MLNKANFLICFECQIGKPESQKILTIAIVMFRMKLYIKIQDDRSRLVHMKLEYHQKQNIEKHKRVALWINEVIMLLILEKMFQPSYNKQSFKSLRLTIWISPALLHTLKGYLSLLLTNSIEMSAFFIIQVSLQPSPIARIVFYFYLCFKRETSCPFQASSIL